MERFRDQPCDYADATLLVASEVLGVTAVLTLDGHFFAYRLSNGVALHIIF
jgi:predicted nucleic acid-binding protein